MNQWVEAFGLKDAQTDAVTIRGRDVMVSAGAGSGKTRTLVARYLSLLDEGHHPRGLAAITFTEKAAREMRNRIRKAISDWRLGACPDENRSRWEAIEAEIDTARIGTIHALCVAILRAHPAEAAIDPRFDVLDEGLSAALRAQAVNEALNWAVLQPDLQPLFEAFESISLARLLTQLLASPLEAWLALAVSDPATRWSNRMHTAVRNFVDSDVVRAAIADLRALDADPQLTADAGDKLAEQVKGLLAEWKLLETHLVNAAGPAAAYTLFNVRRNYCAGNVGKKGSSAKEAVKALRETYDKYLNPWLGGKDKNELPLDSKIDIKAADLLPLITGLFKRAVALYKAAKDKRQALDFDDLERKTVELIERPEIRVRWQKQIAALMVDEFQDTNARQRKLVESLAGTFEGKAGRLFVVGDAKQSIYRFRGAEVTIFHEMGKAIEMRGGLSLILNRTYRAHIGLISVVNEIMSGIMGEVELSDEPYRVPFTALSADRLETDAKITRPYIEFICGLGETADDARPITAQLLACRLWELQAAGNVQWDDIALLFRTSTGFQYYEAALEAAGIPFVTVAGRGFYERPEIRDMLNILHALADPWDDLALAGALRSPAFGLSDEALYYLRWPTPRSASEPQRLHTALQGDLGELSDNDQSAAIRARNIFNHLRGWVDRVPVAELLKALYDETHYLAILAGHPQGARLRRNLNKLLADAHASKLVRLSEFLEYVETLRDVGVREGEAPSDAGGAVRLMTVHKAKGLEFPLVVLADAAHSAPPQRGEMLLSSALGLVPSPTRWESKPPIFRLARQAEAAQENAEDARLIYVAATRAREKLIISGHVTGRAGNTWLVQLANAAGVNLDTLAQQPGNLQIVTLRCGQTVSALVSKIAEMTVAITEDKQVALQTELAPLFISRKTPLDEEISDGTPRRLRRITGRLRQPDGTIVGMLVHQAIHRWCFPGDFNFDRLLQMGAKSLGIVDSEQAATHIVHAIELLTRFRADERWIKLDVAKRAGYARHEVPYSLLVNGLPSGGIIDLLYRDDDNKWQVVDFKTDTLLDEAALDTACSHYASQMRRYRAATEQLLGQSITPMLCFLDACGSVRWVSSDL